MSARPRQNSFFSIVSFPPPRKESVITGSLSHSLSDTPTHTQRGESPVLTWKYSRKSDKRRGLVEESKFCPAIPLSLALFPIPFTASSTSSTSCQISDVITSSISFPFFSLSVTSTSFLLLPSHSDAHFFVCSLSPTSVKLVQRPLLSHLPPTLYIRSC